MKGLVRMAQDSGNTAQSEVRIFVSYAREDSKWLDRGYAHNLIPFLKDSLLRKNVSFWFDKTGLNPGDEFAKEIASEIESSQIALLVVSQNFLNSEFIENREMPRIHERARQGKMIVIPVLVEECLWGDYPFLADRQMVPGPMPLIEYTESEAGWSKIKFQILSGLKGQVDKIRAGSSAKAAGQEIVPRQPFAAVVAEPAGRKAASGPQPLVIEPARQDAHPEPKAPTSSAKKTLLFDPKPLPKYVSDEVRGYYAAALAGDAEAQFQLGKCYYYIVGGSNGIPEDRVESVHWLRAAADQGHAGAMFELAERYAYGDTVEKDKSEAGIWTRKAFEVFRAAADRGDAAADYQLGVIYCWEFWIEKDDAEALRRYRRAAEKGYAEAMHILGYNYEEGYGVEKNAAESERWYERAAIGYQEMAEQGDIEAQCKLASAYFHGQGVTKDLSKVAYWYRQAAEKGNNQAQYNLGQLLDVWADEIKTKQRSEDEYIRWYRKAAEQGNREAMWNLGGEYWFGSHIPKDIQKAIYWYRMSAEYGKIFSMMQLGDIYEKGEGVGKDLKEALRWYRMAADKGDDDAREAVERLS